MANTFKFGAGEWYGKKDTILAYNDENSNYKPLPFTFSRDSTGTIVNENGLIETVGIDEPRVDYLDNADGHLLLEPSRTNLITNYTGAGFAVFNGASITANDSTSPDGTNNATLMTTTGSSNELIQQASITISSGQSYTVSGYFKLKSGTLTDSDNAFKGLDGLNGGGITGSTFNSTLTSEWQRLSFTVTSSTTSGRVQIKCEDAAEILVWGLQVELGGYETSIITTNGSSVTRAADDIALTFPDVDSFNSSNGFSVISKFGIGAAGSSTSSPFLKINDDTSSTYIGFGSTNTRLRCRVNLSGTDYLNTQGNALRTQDNSLFISCDSSGWSQGANGTTNFTGSNDASVIDKLASITYTPSEIYGIIKIKELLIYNTRLTDAELETLTT